MPLPAVVLALFICLWAGEKVALFAELAKEFFLHTRSTCSSVIFGYACVRVCACVHACVFPSLPPVGTGGSGLCGLLMRLLDFAASAGASSE